MGEKSETIKKHLRHFSNKNAYRAWGLSSSYIQLVYNFLVEADVILNEISVFT